MGDQERLFRLALEALSVRASYRPGKGWELVVNSRRGDETWEEAPSRTYTHLSTPELFDVIVADLERALNL